MDKREFDKLYVAEDLAVHCKTLELAREFLSLANYFGYRWSTGVSYNEKDNWGVYEEDTCYYIKKGGYSKESHYKPCGLRIIEYSGFDNLLITW